MVPKSEEEVESEKDKREDEIFMAQLRKIADSIIPMLKTEEDFPSKHPELNFKVPTLDMGVWVEDTKMAAPGMELKNIHSTCIEGECLPIGTTDLETQGLETHHNPATRMVPQINYQFYAKPSLPKTTIMCSSANPLQQKRTTFTQEVIRRLLRTRKQQNCEIKQVILNGYMQILKKFGYSAQFRSEILKGGIKGYNKILEDERSGHKPIYKSKEW